MTTIQSKLKELEKRRDSATLRGLAVGGFLGFIFTLSFSGAFISGIAVGTAFWYFTSLPYWEYRDSLTLPRRKR